MAQRWTLRFPTGSIVGMQMTGHMLLSRGLWRSAGTAADAVRLLPPAPVLSAAAALPAEIDDVLFYTMLGMSLPRGQPNSGLHVGIVNGCVDKALCRR